MAGTKQSRQADRVGGLTRQAGWSIDVPGLTALVTNVTSIHNRTVCTCHSSVFFNMMSMIYTNEAPSLTHKHLTRLERLARNKRSGLL